MWFLVKDNNTGVRNTLVNTYSILEIAFLNNNSDNSYNGRVDDNDDGARNDDDGSNCNCERK